MPETQILTISEAMEITQEIPEIFAQLLELYNAEVEFVELGVEGDQIIIREVEKSNPTSSSVHVPSVNRDRDKLLVSKAVDEEKRYTLAPWYVPDVLDAHGEWTDKEEVQRAFWDYLKREDRSIRLQHNMDIIAGEWVEGLTWPHGVTVPIKHPEGETEITFPAGTPFLGVIWEPWAWQLIKDGEIRGLSIGGRGKRVEADIEDYDYDPMGKVSFAKMIRTEADRYAVYAYDDSSSFGEYDSRQEAEERLKQIEYFAKADFKVGDFVSWNSSGGRARGKIQTIAIDREIKVPDSSFTITGTNEEPAALIVVWREGADGWEKTDRKVGHKLDALTPIDALQKTEALSPLQSVVNNAKTFLEKHLQGKHDQSSHGRKNPNFPRVNDKPAQSNRDPKAVELAIASRGKYSAVENERTELLSSLAAANNGEMTGLAYRLKDTDSLARKIQDDSTKKGISMEEAADDLFDVNRYTMQFQQPPDQFTSSVSDTLSEMEKEGFTIVQVKNTLQNETADYRGVNVKLEKDGLAMELQFHTPASAEAKEKNHPLYAIYREERDPVRANELFREMQLNTQSIPMPKDIDLLGA
jgi:hypothetical protein